MKYKVTVKKLEKFGACEEGIDWFKSQKETDLIKLLQYSIKNEFRLDWANWLIVRFMKYEQYVKYAVYAAKQVLPIFESKYPDDKRPRKAINAAIKCIKNPSKENKKNADSAATAASVAADAAFGFAYYAAYAAFAAYAAADAAAAVDATADAAAAVDATAANVCVGATAANVCVGVDDAYEIKMQIKILKYGLKLLK